VAALREHLTELEAAGADEAILVLDPINEFSLVTVAKELGLAESLAQARGVTSL
jgi:hypothetical protein